MTREKLVLKARGLSRYGDPISERPEGSLNVAENVVIDKAGSFSPRRGFELLTDDSLPQGPAKALIPYSDKLLAYSLVDGSDTNYTLYNFDEDAGTITAYSDFVSTNSTIRSAQAGGSIFFTSTNNIYKLDAIDGTFREAGVPAALYGSAALTSVASGYLGTDKAVSYRVIWGYKDANDKLILGAPSAPIIVSNSTGSSEDVTITIQVPAEIQDDGGTTGYFYQLYRTGVVDGASADPGDDHRLVYEETYASGTTMSVTDRTPDTLRDVANALYSNENQEGIAQANYQPPKASDIALFNGYMFYAGLTYRQSYIFQLLGTGTNGLQVDDTIVIAGKTYTAKGTETAGSRQFLVSLTGSPATDIRLTCESLVRVVNYDTEATVYAYYDSGSNDLPGIIRIEERDFGGAAFNLKTTTAASNAVTSPDLDTQRTSTAEDIPNGLAFSKYQEYEAVPLVNVFRIGSEAGEIKRILALRDSLFIFKEDGIYRLTGTSSSSFSIEAFDTTTNILAPNTLVVLNNQAFGLFDQGVCKVSETGVSIISRDIEGDIKGWMGSHLANLKSMSFAIPYETDRKYLLWVPTSSLDIYPSEAYVFNTGTESWTTYDRNAISGVVNPVNDRLYISAGEIGSSTFASLGEYYLSKERKEYTFLDYADEQFSVSVTAVSTTTLTVTDVTDIAIDDIYYEASNKFARITDIDTVNNQITTATDLEFRPSSSTETFEYTDVDTDEDTITLSSPNYRVYTGLQCTITSDDTLPGGLAEETTYYINKISSSLIQLSLTDGGDAVDLTSQGAGIHTLNITVTPQIRKAYQCTVEWNPIHLDSAGHLKQFYEAAILTSSDFRTATVSFKTNLSGGWESVDLTGVSIGNWGLFDWGEAVWGGDVGVVTNHRTYVPRTKQRAGVMYVRFRTNTVFAGWDLSGIELTYRDAGARSNK